MSISQSNNNSHNATVAAAEAARQAAVVPGATQVTVRTAEIAFYRAVKASAIANSCGVASATRALMELGTGGQ